MPLPVSENKELDRSWTHAPSPLHGQMSRGKRQKTKKKAKKELVVSLTLTLAGPGLQNTYQTGLTPDLDNLKNTLGDTRAI